MCASEGRCQQVQGRQDQPDPAAGVGARSGRHAEPIHEGTTAALAWRIIRPSEVAAMFDRKPWEPRHVLNDRQPWEPLQKDPSDDKGSPIWGTFAGLAAVIGVIAAPIGFLYAAYLLIKGLARLIA
jgi:hypothetical protein